MERVKTEGRFGHVLNPINTWNITELQLWSLGANLGPWRDAGSEDLESTARRVTRTP
jgi:hypothetical protein